jgi:hypothetical protein
VSEIGHAWEGLNCISPDAEAVRALDVCRSGGVLYGFATVGAGLRGLEATRPG